MIEIIAAKINIFSIKLLNHILIKIFTHLSEWNKLIVFYSKISTSSINRSGNSSICGSSIL